MNLKRLRGIATVALITIAAALFAGCSNSMAGSVDGDYQMATLSLSATGIPNDYAAQFEKSYPTAAKAAARSITPDKPFSPNATANPDGTTLTFYLMALTLSKLYLQRQQQVQANMLLKRRMAMLMSRFLLCHGIWCSRRTRTARQKLNLYFKASARLTCATEAARHHSNFLPKTLPHRAA